jgi:hypothetical protein
MDDGDTAAGPAPHSRMCEKYSGEIGVVRGDWKIKFTLTSAIFGTRRDNKEVTTSPVRLAEQ